MLSSRAIRVSARSYSSAVSAVKLTTKDTDSKLSSLSVIVNAGSKYSKSGLPHLLSKFAFLNTESKSALRLTRESELLGGSFKSSVTRDSIILHTQFLKEDLPYFVNALGDTLATPAFRPHELTELVIPAARVEFAANSSNTFKALESLHQSSFRKGLGQSLYYDNTVSSSLEEIKQFASEAYTLSNIEIVASNVVRSDLDDFVNNSALATLSQGTKLSVPTKTYTGTESRLRASGPSTVAIGIPVSTSEFGKYELLSTLLGSSTLGSSSTPLGQLEGVSAISQLFKYQDAGLFAITVESSNADKITAALKKIVSLLKSTSDLSSAVKATELSLALQGYKGVTLNDTKFKLAKFNLAVVGNTDALPFADEL